MQYERELPNAAPPNDVETQYMKHLLSWLDEQRSNASAPLNGRLAENVVIAGISPFLAQQHLSAVGKNSDVLSALRLMP